MGFDIKAHIEVKIGGEWHHYSCPSIPRNYQLFDFLGGDWSNHIKGGRGSRDKFILKGLPSDISVVTQVAYNKDEGGLFDPSWITIDELNTVIEQFPELSSFNFNLPPQLWNPLGYLFDNSVESFWKYRSDYPQEVEDVRMVFWFK